MNNEIKEYSENLETITNETKNLRQKIASLNYKIDDINNKKNNITGRMIYYGIFAGCSIFSFMFATLPSIMIGLGIVATSAICLGLASYKKKKYDKEIAMHTNKISDMQVYIDKLTQEASKNSIAISECYKRSNAQSLTNNNHSKKMSNNTVEFVK